MQEIFKRLDHIGIAVHNLDQAEATYGGHFGLTAWERIALPERSMEVAVGQVGDTLIELIAPTSSEAAFYSFLEKRGEGLHHIAYEVEQIDTVLEHLANQGVRLIDQEARPGIHNTRVAFVHPKEVHGVLVELVEHAQTH